MHACMHREHVLGGQTEQALDELKCYPALAEQHSCCCLKHISMLLQQQQASHHF